MADTRTPAQRVYDQLNSAPIQHPASARLFADWLLQAGDVVTVTSGNESYQVPVYNMEMTWKGSPIVEVDATGNKERPPLPALARRSYSGARQQQEEMDGISSRIAQANNKIGLVVEERSGGNVIRAAEIAAAINDSGSAAYINADHIYLSGTTTLSGTMEIVSGGLKVNTPANISGGDLTVTGTGATVSATNFSLYSGGKISFNTSTPGTTVQVGAADVTDMIIKAAVDGNTLQLWKRGADTSGSPSLTFSKATTLSDGWSGDTYTVTATQNGSQVGRKSTKVYLTHSPGGANYANFDAMVYHDDYSVAANLVLSTRVYLVDNASSSRVEARWGSTTGTVIAAQGYTSAAVTLNDPTWGTTTTSESNTFTVSASNGESKSQTLYLTGSAGSRTVYLRKESTSGVQLARYIVSDSDLTAGNIKSGVNIFGVTGTYTGETPTISATTPTSVSSARPGSKFLKTFASGSRGTWEFKVSAGTAIQYYYLVISY